MSTITSECVQPRLAYYYNGRIYTMDRLNPITDHMLVCGERVWHCSQGPAPLGLNYRDASFASTRRQLADSVEFIDLNGRVVIPGICDAHVHFMMWSMNLALADLTPSVDEDDAIEILKRHSTGTAPGEWILGRGWSYNTWKTATLPSKKSLDQLFPDNPVLMDSKCGHLAWANSRALAIAGINDSTPNPVGGEIEHRDGRITGVLKETAIEMVAQHVPKPDDEQRLRAMKKGQSLAHSLGLTSMQTPEDLDTWGFLQRAHAKTELSMRIDFWMPVSALDEMCAAQTNHGLGDDHLRISAVKVFMDGSLGGRTAQMYEPYENEPGNLGIIVTERQQIIDYTLKANAANLSMAVHAIGDKAVANVMDAYELAAQKFGRNGTTATNPVLRNRIEHLQVFHESDRERLRTIRPIASMQPVHLCADMGPADIYWGSRSRNAYAFRDIADAGCLLAFGSDAPVETINPFEGIYAAVTRNDLQGNPGEGWNPSQKVTMDETLHAYTSNCAIASGRQADLGTLQSGYLADFLVLPGDPYTESPETVRDMKPLMTFSGGKPVYCSTEWECRNS